MFCFFWPKLNALTCCAIRTATYFDGLWSFISNITLLQVIRTLDPKHISGAAPEVQALRNQLQEKDRLIEHLEVSFWTFGFQQPQSLCACITADGT